MATEDAFNQAAEAKRRSDELIWRVHNGSGGGDAASGIQNTGPLRQLEVRCNTSTFVYVNQSWCRLTDAECVVTLEARRE